ncbi:MAG: hypothetical protein RLZZ428_678 [Pseudomonadota bacterium]|jgi:molybdopterin-guanine dinucleotide biosynthesis protein A
MSVAVIVAGGKSSRMGEDKALLPFGGYTTLAEFQYRKLKPYFETVYLSTKENKFDFHPPIIIDKDAIYSPLVAIITLFESLQAEEIFILSVDAPFVDKMVIEQILNHAQNTNDDAIIAQTPSGEHPLCGVYRRSILPLAKMQLAKENHKLKDLLSLGKTSFIGFALEDKFANLNYPEEYHKAFKAAEA